MTDSKINPNSAAARTSPDYWLYKWLLRHQNATNYRLHIIGIPMTVLALCPLIWDFTSLWMWVLAAVLFLTGYGLQFLGHAIEGNDAGELIAVKKWLGKPYRAIAPQYS